MYKSIFELTFINFSIIEIDVEILSDAMPSVV